MKSKFGEYCENFIEAAWLVVILVMPIFFNIYSSRIFEPDKIVLLRSITVLVIVFWILKIFADGNFRIKNITDLLNSDHIRATPIVWAVAATGLVYFAATIFSVNPRISLAGSYQRLQGTYTMMSYLVLFATMAVFLRRREQIDRLISAIIVASIPVAYYGILQRFALDPIPWGADTAIRVASNLGNSIFVAAYLVMVVPLTMVRIVDTLKVGSFTTSPAYFRIVKIVLYTIILILQLMTIYFSGSRGPVLGLLAGMYFMILLVAIHLKKRLFTALILILAVLGVVFLVVFNMQNGPLERLKSSTVVGRFGRLLDTSSNTAKVRLYIWEGAARMVAPHMPIQYPNGETDRLNALRMIFGYGPESMYVSFSSFYVPELGQVERRNASPDRSHNETWDSMIITGTVGLIVYLGTFLIVFFSGLKMIGWIKSRKEHQLYWGLCAAGGLLASVIVVLWGVGRRFVRDLPGAVFLR